MEAADMRAVACFFLLCVVTVLTGSVSGKTEAELLKHLFEKNTYYPAARPLKDPSHTITVNISLHIIQFGSLNDQEGSLSFSAYFITNWVDELLQWNLTEYPIKYIAPLAFEVWTPDFGLMNTANSFYQRTLKEDHRVRLESTGRVTWAAGTSFITTCSYNVQHFPFDEQQCDIVFANVMYSSDSVELELRQEAPLQMDQEDVNGLWEVTGSTANKSYSHEDGLFFPTVTYTVFFRRRPLYYLLNIGFPCVLLVICTLAMFWLPHESGERVSMGITVMLSYSVTNVVLDGYLPVSSVDQAKMGILINVLMSVTCLATVLSIGHIQICRNYKTPVSRGACKFVFGILATLFCVRNLVPNSVKLRMKEGNRATTSSDRVNDRPEENETETMSHEGGYPVGLLLKRYDDQDKEDEITEEWRAFTRILDYLYFWMSLVIFILSFIFLFLSA